MAIKKTANDLISIPEYKKPKDISEYKKAKTEKPDKKEKKEKKPKISLEQVKKVYKILVSEELPDYSDISDDAERKKLITAIKKVLK